MQKQVLIGYPRAGCASVHSDTVGEVVNSIYGLVASGLWGQGQGALSHQDITGRGARVVRDCLGLYSDGVSVGRGVSRLFKLERRGKGRRAHTVRVLIGKRGGGRGRAVGKRARSVGDMGADTELDNAAARSSWLRASVPGSHWAEVVSRFSSVGAWVFVPSWSYALA
jgi:hypothetical protein